MKPFEITICVCGRCNLYQVMQDSEEEAREMADAIADDWFNVAPDWIDVNAI